MKTLKLLTVAALGVGIALAAQAQEPKDETVDMKSIPAAAQKTLKDKAAGRQIIRVEKEIAKGKTVYEAVVNKNGKEWAIEVDANGKYLRQHDEATEDKAKGEKTGKH